MLTAAMASTQVDDAATNGSAHPPVSEADLKEALLASCRTLYEVQPFPLTDVPVSTRNAGSTLPASAELCNAVNCLKLQSLHWH